ncbi:hypothetical protein FYJ34_07455 [Clostridiaceae bacterium 68-1-5]|uniref:Uncharacterized protein n=1 Tax=Suipraeoptans intestinalis TaxID=2606628 RepID=A0A6N7V1Q1_9FIRM|nr:hypothetical protein [Suipraeoptans intestinalis]MSR94097.1 hypothetical protein [Suipraeoptans intestinalis]
MGEYYNWVNVDKKEYICPADFDYGNKLHESMHKDSTPLFALHSLLMDSWKGDRILWFGDECSVPEQSSNNVIQLLYNHSAAFGYPGDAFDTICESYRNVSCFFKEAEKDVREEIGYYLDEYRETGRLEPFNEYGIDLDNPFDGLFFMTGKRRKYTVNHTKKIYYSLDETDILFQDHTKNDFSDPLPLLLGYGRIKEPGEWIGDIIGVSDQRPEGYSLIKEIYVDW